MTPFFKTCTNRGVWLKTHSDWLQYAGCTNWNRSFWLAIQYAGCIDWDRTSSISFQIGLPGCDKWQQWHMICLDVKLCHHSYLFRQGMVYHDQPLSRYQCTDASPRRTERDKESLYRFALGSFENWPLATSGWPMSFAISARIQIRFGRWAA